jgi:putative oxidoreductase
MNWLGKLTEFAYAMLRIVAGFMFSFHGVQKLFGVMTTSQPAMFTLLWFGGIIELVGGVAIMLGVRTRLAAFLCSGMMAVAYFKFHWKFQGGAAFFPTVNQGELAALYCFVFFFIACRGGKMWSLGKD